MVGKCAGTGMCWIMYTHLMLAWLVNSVAPWRCVPGGLYIQRAQDSALDLRCMPLATCRRVLTSRK
jgi:hypothetical protein